MLEESGDEEETNGIVNKVLDEIGIEISGKVTFLLLLLLLRFFFRIHSFSVFIHIVQMSDAPSAVKDSIGHSTKVSDKDIDIEAQLAKLRST